MSAPEPHHPTAADWVAGARPRTLPAAVVPVLVGAGAAVGASATVRDGIGAVVWWRVVGALVVALLLQVGVNYANDYSDGVRGSDDVRVGPMRLVATGVASPAAVKRAALVAFGVAAIVGLALAASTTWWLVAIGASAIAAAWGYTGGPRPYGYMGLGEVFVFVYFGVVATVGTTYLAIERIPWQAWVAGCGVGLLACSLLVINNLRDIPTDAAVGKRTLAVRIGDAGTRHLYVATVVGAFIAAAVTAASSPWALLALLAFPMALMAVGEVRDGASGHALIPLLGATGRVQLVYGALYAAGLAI